MSVAIDRPPEGRRLAAALALTLAILIALFAGVFFWRAARQSAGAAAYAPPPVEVSAQPVQFETLPQSLEATGALQAVKEVTLAAEVPGRVVAIYFTAGAQVAAGTPLLQLFDGPERADLAAALSRAEFAKLQYSRTQSLAPAGVESQQLLQQRQAELSQGGRCDSAGGCAADAKDGARTVRWPDRPAPRRSWPVCECRRCVGDADRSGSALCRFHRAAAGSFEVERRRRGHGSIRTPIPTAALPPASTPSSRLSARTPAT